MTNQLEGALDGLASDDWIESWLRLGHVDGYFTDTYLERLR